MSNTSQLNQTQRQAFEKTLREQLSDAQRALTAKKNDAHEMVLQKLLESQEAVGLAATVKQLTLDLEKAEELLQAKGFEVRNDGSVRINYNAPGDLEQQYEALVEEQTASEQDKVDSIAQALRDSWQIANLDEAKKLVESFA